MITSLLLGGSIFILLLVIALYVVYVIGLWKLFKKAGKQGWEAIIPFYNTYVLVEISGLNWWYFLIAISGTILGMLKINGLDYVATPKPVDFPNLCANSMYILNNAYMLANGIKNSTIYHNGNSVISNSTIILYIGTIEAHPGLPAFLKIFHKLTIISIEARLPPINGNVPIDDVVDTPAE